MRTLYTLTLMLAFAVQAHAQSAPNILLVIADDLGVDRLRGYHNGDLMATTPTLDSLRGAGITFLNATAAPSCSPTRASIMTGKYGSKTGVLNVPGNLGLNHTTLFAALDEQTDDAYATALIGKWHLTQPLEPGDPLEFGPDFYDGYLRGAPDDYFNWSRVQESVASQETTYVTTALTDAAINWIDEQTQPWFLWLAHAAPHSPFHVPPAGTYTVANPTNNRRQYVAMVEALDFEVGRMLAALDADVRDNTLVIFVGDNGTPGNVDQDYPAFSSKGSLYQGGIRVPLIVAGKGVSRSGARERALVHVTDLYATILEAAGATLPGGQFNSLSYYPLLSDAEDFTPRTYNFVETEDAQGPGWAIRSQRYKLINFSSGTQELYDLEQDSFELNNLLTAPLSQELEDIRADLEAEGMVLNTDWSCRDYIQNGEETGIDCGTDVCGICTTSTTAVDMTAPLKLWPNPCTDLLQLGDGTLTGALRAANGEGEIIISDMAGRAVRRQPAANAIRIGELPTGVYHVELRTSTGRWVGKVVKE